jgi:hypothetical protein
MLCSWSTFRSAAFLFGAWGLSAVFAGSAHGQACCASAGLVAPTRLRSYEDIAVGVQAKGRTVFGAFNPDGGYASSAGGESEWTFEQDLFGVLRLFNRGQVSLLLPFVETRSRLPGIRASGGGIGDLALNARYDFISTGERGAIPGVAVLLGAVFPTGTSVDDATTAADATGQGSFEANGGVAVEQAFGQFFATAQALVGFRTSRRVANVNESFVPRFTALAAAGRMLPHGATIGAFVSGMRQGDNQDAGGPIAGSGVSLLTVGAASTVSPTDYWRVQGTASGNIPIGGTGRNQTAGVGVTLSLIRLWL